MSRFKINDLVYFMYNGSPSYGVIDDINDKPIYGQIQKDVKYLIKVFEFKDSVVYKWISEKDLRKNPL